MRLSDFDAMVRRMADEVPAEYLDGVAEIVVSPRALPHPTRAEIWTLGECVPLPAVDTDPESVQSRIVLYYGSFVALAGSDGEFHWREEAWETLTHELRHHLEWRARTDDLEALDRAAEANYARLDGDPFDPLFYQDGETQAPGVYRVEDDYFLEQVVSRVPDQVLFQWHGRDYRFDVPADVTLPAFCTVVEVDHPPPGDLIVVLRRRASLRQLIRQPVPRLLEVTVRPAPTRKEAAE
jgi:predicted Zn-dependent protease with MMP-like domain